MNRLEKYALAIALLLLGGCAASPAITRRVKVPPRLEVAAVAVYPFGFRWEEPAWRSFELSQRLVDRALARHGERLRFFGPGEFRVYRAEDDNPWAASDMVAHLPRSGVRPEQTLVLRPWAERTTASSQLQATDGRGRTARELVTEETTFVAHVELLHPSSGALVAELTARVTADPFAVRTDEGADPAPELTALLERMVDEALDVVGGQLLAPPPAVGRAAVRFALSPGAALAFREGGRPSLQEQLPTMDPLDAELLRDGRARFANPGLEEPELARLRRVQTGLWVREAAAGLPLTRGDVVLEVEDEPALPQTYARARLRGVPFQLKVRRADGRVEAVTIR